jgi:aromatic ring-opening dioxygenase LigB subunit
MTNVDINISQIRSNIKHTNEIINEYKKETEKLKKSFKKEMIKKKQCEEFILET